MEVIVGKTAGFCFGVANAINKTKKALEEEKKIYCLGELVHNKEVIKELQNNGVAFINKVEEANGNVIIRAHGEPEKTYKKIKELKLNLIDLTCPKVMKIHDIAKEYAKNGFYILLVGQKEHPEIIGTISYCGRNSDIIEKEENIDKIIDKLNSLKIKKILIISQTTFSLEKFKNITEIIKRKLGNIAQIEIKNTICNATKLRQEEAYEIAKKVDLMIIIGGKNSSNSDKLYKISKSICNNSLLIENYRELDINYIKKFNRIGIMAGASTPQKSINSVVEMLNKI